MFSTLIGIATGFALCIGMVAVGLVLVSSWSAWAMHDDEEPGLPGKLNYLEEWTE